MSYVVIMKESLPNNDGAPHRVGDDYDMLEDARREAERRSKAYPSNGYDGEQDRWWGRHGDGRLFHFFTMTDAAFFELGLVSGPYRNP